ALALGGSAGDVINGGLVESHSHDHGPIDRGVELSVSSMVDAMLPTCHTRPCRDGADAGEFRERSLGLDALGVVSCHDEDFCGSVHANAELVEQMGRALEDEFLDHA